MQYLKFNSYTINPTQSLPSLRGDVNEVDRRELKKQNSNKNFNQSLKIYI